MVMFDEEAATLMKSESTAEQKRLLTEDTLQAEAMQEASAELQAADAEFERLKGNPEKPEAWDALERRYECHKKLWLMFGGAPCNVRINTMFNQFCERLLKPHKADA
jgi:hypothetical protein